MKSFLRTSITRTSVTSNAHNSARTGSQSSTFLGRQYEEECLKYLGNNFGMDLERVGQANDGGVDLRGWVRTRRQRWRAYIQCKAEGSPLGPRHVREVEGMLSARRRGSGAFAGLCSATGFSKKALEAVEASSLPIAAWHIAADGDCLRALVNTAMARALDVNIRVSYKNAMRVYGLEDASSSGEDGDTHTTKSDAV